MNLDISGLDAEFAPTRSWAPHLIPALHENGAVIPLPPNLPALQVAPDRVAPHPPFPNQGTPRYQPFEKLDVRWPVYSDMDYIGLDQHLREEWYDQHDVQEGENGDDEDIVDNTESQQHGLLPTGSPSTKRNPMSDERRLLQQIHAPLHIPTLDLLDPAMPYATRAPEFGPFLEPRPQE